MRVNTILIGLLVMGIFSALGERQTITARRSVLSEPTYAISNSDANDLWQFGEYPYRQQSNKQGLIRVHGRLEHKNAEVVGSKFLKSRATKSRRWT
jgi:hypothetical protein